MNENFPLKLSHNFCCASCKFQFYIKDFTLKGSRCPMLLYCGHSICNYCLQQNSKGANNITCQFCGFISSWDSSDLFSKCFSLNMYMLGSLFVFQNSKLEKDKRLAFLAKNNGDFNYAVLGQSNVVLKPDSGDSVCEECSLKAFWHCENCRSNFCEICWSRVHGSAKSLTKHYRTAISEVSKTGLKKCIEHETQNLEFFCKDCSKTVCSHCVILQHQGEGHHSITLKEKNLEMISDVKTAAEDANRMIKRMKQTLEEIKLKQNTPGVSENKTYLDLENQIMRNFSRIHGILQVEEERLLKKLHEKSSERENRFRSLQAQLEKQMGAVEYLLREYDFALKKPQSSDLTDLYRQLTEVRNLPCYLFAKKSGDEEAKVEFDERLIDLLRVYCTMDLPSHELFELRSSSDLPEGYAVNPLNVSYQSSEEGQESNVLSVPDLDTLSNCSSRELQKEHCESVSDLSKYPKEPKVFLERKSYCVRISFIKSPGEFYVTLNSQRAKQRAIDRRASAVARSSSAVPQTYGKGEIYLVKYNVDKKWYRGRLMEVISSRRTGGEESVLVYYLDYGNFEIVPISRLRPIPEDLLEEPPLAIKCKLFDCVPQNDEWCADSTKTMEKILKNHPATMFVMKVHSDCLEVDLSVIYPEGQIGRDIVSVRDALLFLGFSSFVHGFKVPRNATAFKYLDQCLPPVGESFDVTVTHVNSPSDFYVQRTKEDASYLYKLATDLQSYYEENSERGMIYNPILDMPCAALFSADQRWYRAKIVDVPGKKMVTVFYVDYGNKETIQWTEIRKLKESFAKCPPLAFNCALDGILPVNGAPWSTHAKWYLKKNVLMRDGRVVIQGKSRQKLKVLLYKKGNKKDVCVNKSFVEMGFAIKSFDLECFWTEEKEEENDVLNVDEIKSDEETETSQVASEIEKGVGNNEVFKVGKRGRMRTNSEATLALAVRFLPRARESPSNFLSNPDSGKSVTVGNMPGNVSLYQDRKKSKPSAKELREMHESEKQNHTEEQFSTTQAENEVDDYKNIFKVKVDVLSAESPSSIYVTFPTLMEEFENLQAKLNEFYQDTTNSPNEWTVGSICAVFDSAKRSWFRASILLFLPNDRVQVFLKDVACVTSEPVSALRTLDPSFKKYSSCAIKCHLADVRPPGDEWPSISSEYLLEELDNHNEVYMTKRGQTENGSLPIELWVQKILSRGALEPIKKEWITLNRLLVSQGLAVPVKLEIWSGLEFSTEDEQYSDEEKSTDNNQTGSVQSDKADLLDVSNGPEVFVPALRSGWIPPLPLKQSRFIGIPTYVDFNAFIYMYDTEQDEENLKTIREVLLKEYGNSKPTPEDYVWVPGQLCIARYHADNFWYRGLVLQELEDMTYDVLFVDYGNVETCQVADLRKKIKMHDIPILTHKFQLHGIETVSKDGEWPVSVVDILHSLVVDKKCEVNILKRPQNPNEAHVISLKVIESDIEVGTFLVEKNLAFVDVSDPSDNGFFLMPTELGDDSEELRYVPLVIPDNCNEFFIEVTNVSSETEFFANIVFDESLPSSLKKVLDGFKSLQEKLTEECQLQPPVENFTVGHPCCCLDFTNNKWCRGEIESFIKNKHSVCVSYVDYGTKEFLHKDFIRESKDCWVEFPKMAVKLKLGGIEKCVNVPESAYRKALIRCLNLTPLFAEILKEQGQFLEVRLLTKRNGPLAYQEMIDEGLMKII